MSIWLTPPRAHTQTTHQGALICPTAADEVDAEAAAADGPASTTSNNSSSKRPLRLRPLAVLLPLQQFGFPMRNLGLQRRIGYELLFYRAGERGAQGGEEGEEGVKVFYFVFNFVCCVCCVVRVWLSSDLRLNICICNPTPQ